MGNVIIFILYYIIKVIMLLNLYGLVLVNRLMNDMFGFLMEFSDRQVRCGFFIYRFIFSLFDFMFALR
jgi:hypothetical protein